MASSNPTVRNPRMVIIGAGFGDLSAAKRLAKSPCRITLIDRHNYHLFQRGFIAWLLWSVARIYFLIGFRNRIVVAMSWAWSYITFQRGTRLITGLSGSRMEDMPMPVPMNPSQSNQSRHAA